MTWSAAYPIESTDFETLGEHPAVAKSVFEYADGPLVFGLQEVIAGNVEEKVIQFLTRHQVRDWTRSCLRVCGTRW